MVVLEVLISDILWNGVASEVVSPGSWFDWDGVASEVVSPGSWFDWERRDWERRDCMLWNGKTSYGY